MAKKVSKNQRTDRGKNTQRKRVAKMIVAEKKPNGHYHLGNTLSLRIFTTVGTLRKRVAKMIVAEKKPNGHYRFVQKIVNLDDVQNELNAAKSAL